MGLLYKSAMMKRHWKRQYILDELAKFGITHSTTGIPIKDLDYEDLKEQLVLAIFRHIDIEKDDNKWF